MDKELVNFWNVLKSVVVFLSLSMQVPVDLVIDHSVQVDVARSENAVQANMELEFQRNKSDLASWNGDQMPSITWFVVPFGSGIVHQVIAYVIINFSLLSSCTWPLLLITYFIFLGFLICKSCAQARVIWSSNDYYFLDELGVSGWEVGGIEAEATMLGQVRTVNFNSCITCMSLR